MVLPLMLGVGVDADDNECVELADFDLDVVGFEAWLGVAPVVAAPGDGDESIKLQIDSDDELHVFLTSFKLVMSIEEIDFGKPGVPSLSSLKSPIEHRESGKMLSRLVLSTPSFFLKSVSVCDARLSLTKLDRDKSAAAESWPDLSVELVVVGEICCFFV